MYKFFPVLFYIYLFMLNVCVVCTVYHSLNNLKKQLFWTQKKFEVKINNYKLFSSSNNFIESL